MVQHPEELPKVDIINTKTMYKIEWSNFLLRYDNPFEFVIRYGSVIGHLILQ